MDDSLLFSLLVKILLNITVTIELTHTIVTILDFLNW